MADLTDRELLELAAKAAGISARYFESHAPGLKVFGEDRPWNPLTDSGDALRLAVTCGLAVIPYPFYAKPKHSVIAKEYDRPRMLRDEEMDVRIEEVEVYRDDPMAATRRAIVRAAAAIAGQPAQGGGTPTTGSQS